MTLHLHRGTGTDVLADGLGRAPGRRRCADPFAEEVVVVPAKGVERWLTQRLSHRLGAGPAGQRRRLRRRAFPQPPLAGGAADRHRATTTRGTPTGSCGRCSTSSTPRSTSRGARTLARHLGHGADGERAASCGATAATRSSAGWPVSSRRTPCSARRCSPTGARAGTPTAPGRTSPATSTWQAELWRRRWSTEVPAAAARRAARRDAVRAIRAGADLALPDRLSMFGHTRMPVTELELLRAVGEVREVHLWLPQASPAAWAAAPAPATSPTRARSGARDDERGPRC